MPGMATWQLFDALQDTYNLDDDTTLSLVLTYHTYVSDNTKNIKVVRLDRDSTTVIDNIDICTKEGRSLRKICLDNLTLHEQVERGKKVETDVNCDTTFMLISIDDIGSSK